MGTIDQIGANGLEVKNAAQITSDLLNGYIDPFTGLYVPGLNQIYAADINTDSNTPDGQQVGLITQEAVDLRELLVGINASFDPDQAQGALLDQRCAINNIARIGGTYTVQPIVIVTNATVTLPGLDNNYNSPTGTGYTVQDNSGNQWILSTTTTLTAGTNTLDFRAQNIGAVTSAINTITTPVTILAGITSVNNPSAALTVGITQESDAALRIRRSLSTANATSGNSTGLQANLLALPGVTEASVYQNRTSSTDGTGTAAHSIWAIVAGGTASQIAQLLYSTISDGCGMRGSVSYNVPTPTGAPFIAAWDTPTAEPLYIRFSIQQTVAGFEFATTAIQNYIAVNLSYGINQFAETSSITVVALAAIIAQGGGGVPVLVQISIDNSTWEDYLTTSTVASEFTVAAGDITITVVDL